MKFVLATMIAAVVLLAGETARAQAGGRLVEAVEASDAGINVNIYVQFSCIVRYLSHAPIDLGRSITIRLRLGGDCGLSNFGTPSERPLISGDSSFLKTARLEELLPGEVALTLEWEKEVHFVLAPTADLRGVRVRLLEALPGREGKVLIMEQGDPASGYAVNLESARSTFSQEQIEVSSKLLQMQTYVSTIELEGSIWYRLRAGPISTRRDADRLLAAAREHYPRAWLGINDEMRSATDVVPVPPSVNPTVPVDPPMPERERQALVAEARTAMARRDYPRAIDLLTKLNRQPEFPHRDRQQEMLGLAREKSGQLAHAKAEYEEYLRRYPEGSAAGRIRSRLRVLASAGRSGRSGTLGGFGDDDRSWVMSGSASQIYRWESIALETPESSTEQQSQNAIYTDGDFIARHRGERFDFISRVSAGFAKDLMSDGPGDRTRVSYAFAELNDRERGIAGRIGRQSRNDSGLLGSFDGLFGSYQLANRVTLKGSVGLPVESSREVPQTDRRFVGLAADFGPYNDKWDFGVFAVAQEYSGEPDRRAVGLEARYFVPGRTIVGLVDYDFFHSTLNSAILIGSLQLPAQWIASFNIDHRLAPVLTTRNALIGQPFDSLDEMLATFSPDQIHQLARDRTPITDLYSLSLTRPLSERFYFAFDVYGARSAGTPASGGVAATPTSGLAQAVQMQLIGSSLWRSGDLFTVAARYEESDSMEVQSVGLITRLPLWGNWRIGPRLRIDRRTLTLDDAKELVYVPALRVDYQRGNTWVEIEMGAELGGRDLPPEDETWERYYFGLGYRVGF